MYDRLATKSPIKWLGNKSYLAQSLRRLIEKEIDFDSTVIELFSGSLGLSLYFGFPNVLANDTNRELINFFQHQINGDHASPHWNFSKDLYYKAREEYRTNINNDWCKKRRSDLFLFLNIAGFNGLYRVNQKGTYNTPVGTASSFPIAKIQKCREFRKTAQSWIFTSKCFSEFTHAQLNSSGLIYIDPPYAEEFNGYQGSFTMDDQLAVIDSLKGVDTPVIISNSIKNKTLLKAYREAGFRLYRIKVNRYVAANGDKRKQVSELVAFRGFKTKKIRSLCPDLLPLLT
ncbi:hypothetical protein A1QO_04130 [Vibrio genomosp. F10 str. ZF-129]|uniref:Site-specific DNA-methyltransferase (adenine-specific) n=1 Tax=Vibrio genomosp. F10 str. ZF-129 TaxID=1187848 RepID=A0A1E5BIS5_9VIBR|nr:Dam family site-specific DNA-(adenine-N6)-methyltransferase [Vibrio genomosp. F10]OEE37300.1 hypothetical protein A1QO_04130 [Vibrio genomosp. F10 str. ZF-129]